MPPHPPLSTLADAAVVSSGTCHCYPEWQWHNFPVGLVTENWQSMPLPRFQWKFSSNTNQELETNRCLVSVIRVGEVE